MGEKLAFAGALEERLRLPGTALGELELRVLGDRRGLIANHRGLLHCTPELIAVRGRKGCLRVFGTQLRIEAMDGRDLLFSGRLERAEWEA